MSARLTERALNRHNREMGRHVPGRIRSVLLAVAIGLALFAALCHGLGVL